MPFVSAASVLPTNALRCSALTAWCGRDVGAKLKRPDVDAATDLLGALFELASVATFLEHRRLTSPTLSTEVRRIMQCGLREELTLKEVALKGATLSEMRRSVNALSQEMCAAMDLDALVALRVFVQHGGTQGSRSECPRVPHSPSAPFRSEFAIAFRSCSVHPQTRYQEAECDRSCCDRKLAASNGTRSSEQVRSCCRERDGSPCLG